ncbi:MAG: tRNA lysidine(34) synthetase TilS [Steroidobacteraceae bacterium]
MTGRRRAAVAPHSAAPPAALSSAWLARELKELIGPLRGRRLCIAYSGGIDSTALLALAAPLRRSQHVHVRALHIHHGLQAEAGQWAEAAAARCRVLQLPLTVRQVQVARTKGDSPEAAARLARYGAFAEELAAGELLLLAQHQDDQLETVLLQLLRGAGPAGLAAMSVLSSCGAGQLARPLLGVRRVQLEAVVRKQGLSWSEDPSNRALHFDRNYLRHQVLPALLERWPAAAATVSRSAALMAEAQLQLEQMADTLLAQALEGEALSVPILRRFSARERRQVVRRYLRARHLALPDQRRLLEIVGPVLQARADAHTCVRYGEVEIHRFGAQLLARSRLPPLLANLIDWRWGREPALALAGAGELTLVPQVYGPLRLAALPEVLTVRFRQGGERLAMPHGHGSLKHLLQERRVPPWLRARVPLIYAGERLLAVADLWSDPALKAGGGAAARLAWRAP